jgi:hypothetical protein
MITANKTRSGWMIETTSHYQGDTTGRVVLYKRETLAREGIKYGDDPLENNLCEVVTDAEYLLAQAKPDRVIKAGYIVE